MGTEAIAAFDLLSRMRFACGDNGKRMQDELEEYLRGLKRDAERYRFCVERNTMPVIAGDGETWCMFLAVKSNRRSLFTGATPSEAIDAAMNGANAEVSGRPHHETEKE